MAGGGHETTLHSLEGIPDALATSTGSHDSPPSSRRSSCSKKSLTWRHTRRCSTGGSATPGGASSTAAASEDFQACCRFWEPLASRALLLRDVSAPLEWSWRTGHCASHPPDEHRPGAANSKQREGMKL